METTPYVLSENEENMQVYGEYMSGQFAWNYHVSS
jgi:hypothetical protein